jgi:hypothetical protein
MNENKTNINWLITINLNPYGNPYKIKENGKMDLA